MQIGSIGDIPFVVSHDYILSAKAKVESEIFTALKKYEPRVTVKQVGWYADAEGIIRAKVKVVMDETE
jgi:hypothetical protein|nr:MAG TPA: lysozyme [Caudoviricetes sp.]